MIEEEQFAKYRKSVEPLLKEKGFNYDEVKFYNLSAAFREEGHQEVIENISGKFVTKEKKIYSFKLLFQKEGNVLETKEEEGPKGVFSKLSNI
jgi:hypothetical protein